MPFSAAHPSLRRALSERGYTEPTPVQAAVLRPEAAGRDLLVSAQTGSGKTAAYAMAIGATLLGEADRLPAAKELLALIVAPTRELALQVRRELEWLFAPSGLRVISCVGGMDIRDEVRALSRGAHIVVGTPGRLSDHMQRRRLDLSKLKVAVLDEADEMLDLGFREEMEKILEATPPTRRTLMFSATLPKDIVALARKYQREALRIALASENEPHGDIEYRAMPIAAHDREHAVVNVLRYLEVRGALVFCTTRDMVRHLHANLLERGFAVVSLSGELSQSERTHALQALRDGRARVCVATDVAARGLDLPDLGLVIHADLPHDRQTLLHRSGRTGRAGRKGMCVLLVPAAARHRAERLLASAKIIARWAPPPSPDAVRAKDRQRLLQEIITTGADPASEDLEAGRALLAERSAEELAAALVRLHRSLLPAPEELAPPKAERPARDRARPHGPHRFKGQRRQHR